MRMASKRFKHRAGYLVAFTLIELLALIFLFCALGSLFVFSQSQARTKDRARRINCVYNLRQIGLAFKIWSPDQSDQFPMERSVTNGGTLEVTGSDRLFKSFVVVSNELSTPRFLVCPADNRFAATNFGVEFSNANISYFLGLDSSDEQPDMLLAGDRNLTNGLPVKAGILLLPTNCPVGWTHQMHQGQGNVCLADGSVQTKSSAGLWQQLCAGGIATNRLMMP